MKTRVMVLGAVLLGAMLGGVGCAGPKEAARDVESSVPGLSKKTEGVVTNVDKDHSRIAVKPVDKPAEPDVWFALSPNTKMERDGQMVTWDDISEGTPVRVSYEPATGAENTLKLEILTGQQGQDVKQKAEHLK